MRLQSSWLRNWRRKNRINSDAVSEPLTLPLSSMGIGRGEGEVRIGEEDSMADLKGILVVGEAGEGHLAPITRELLGGARQLSKTLEEDVDLLLIGEEMTDLAQEGMSFGADKVYVAENPTYSDYLCDSLTQVASWLCRDKKISLCLMGHTDLGREVAPRVAARLGAGLCMDCVEIKIDSSTKNLIHTRPVYGGRAMAEEASLPGHLQVATVRRTAMAAFICPGEGKGEIVHLDAGIELEAFGKKLVDRKKPEAGGIDLENAKVIIAGGGGIGGKEGFGVLERLAQVLEGAVGATRVPVDEGWVSRSLEIGQTGKIVSPSLYLAVGISGATQHITGILGSKYIVTLNKDPDANIFKVSDLGVVADYRELLPRLIEHLK
jgi:electron transfer flavoprotein alpha subunit